MKKSKSADYQDLLKAIAIVVMIVDHIGLRFIPDMHWLRIIGRFGISIWFFFAGYNYSRPKHLLLQLGLMLSYLVYVMCGDSTLNMLVTIYLGQCYLYLLEKFNKVSDKDTFIHCLFMLLLFPLTYIIFEYGTLTIAFMIAARHQARGGNGICFLPLLSISTMLLTYLCFEGNFTNIEMAAAFFFIGIGSWALCIRPPDMPITVDVRIMSRHTLLIYFVHISSFTIASMFMRFM